jgi:hypothetical protein
MTLTEQVETAMRKVPLVCSVCGEQSTLTGCDPNRVPDYPALMTRIVIAVMEEDMTLARSFMPAPGAPTYEAIVKDLLAAEARIRELEGALREVGQSGVAFDDERIGYVTVQIDRGTWQEIRTLTRRPEEPR